MTDLKPCRACGAPCTVLTFGPNALIEAPFTLWLCSRSRVLGGLCPDEMAYLTEADWNGPDEPKRACPECGDDEHLYWLHASVRWDPEARKWGEPINDEGMAECTECDWYGREEETEVKDGL